MHGWKDWVDGAVDLVVVMDQDDEDVTRGVLFTPEIDRSICVETCRACPKYIAEHLAEHRDKGEPLEVTRQCDGMTHRITFSQSHCLNADKKRWILRSRTLDPGWPSLTDREREIVHAVRKYGWESAPAELGISSRTAWSHRRSICSKCSLVGTHDWHRFVLHNG